MKFILPKKTGDRPRPESDLNLDMVRKPGDKRAQTPHQVRDQQKKEAVR